MIKKKECQELPTLGSILGSIVQILQIDYLFKDRNQSNNLSSGRMFKVMQEKFIKVILTFIICVTCSSNVVNLLF